MDLTGRTLLGKYEIVSLLGAGGMGSVWHAKHSLTGRKLAVKVLDESYLKNTKVMRRFGREARAASAVQHPGIVEVLDIDQTDEGVPFMVMEYLEGETLASRIERRGRLDQDETLRIGSLLLDALEAAHEHGVIHRDLKPENIYLVPAGRRGELVKILDFGISHMREDDGKKLTMTGSVLGTPHYMSPEQAMGDATVDHRADLYAMGVVLYECVVGDVPFDAPNYNKLLRIILDEEPPPPRSRGAEISPEFERVIQWAMSKDVERRVGSAREMKDWLERAAAGEMPEFEPQSGRYLAKPSPKQKAEGPARPAGTLPANRGVQSTLTASPKAPADAWRPSSAPTVAEEEASETEFDWDLGAALDRTHAPSSHPPPRGLDEEDDPLALRPAKDTAGLEIDETAMRPRSVRPPPMAGGGTPRPTPVTGTTGPNAAVSASSAGAILTPSSPPPALPSSHPPAASSSLPPRVRTLSGDYAIPDFDDEDDGPPAWRRYLLFGLLGVGAFVGVVFLLNWIVRPGVDDDDLQVTTQPPAPSPDPGDPDPSEATPRWVSIRIVGIPPEGRVTLDGLPAGSTVRVRHGGEHRLTITAPGYEPRQIEVTADRNRTIHARMRPAPGAVTAP